LAYDLCPNLGYNLAKKRDSGQGQKPHCNMASMQPTIPVPALKVANEFATESPKLRYHKDIEYEKNRSIRGKHEGH